MNLTGDPDADRLLDADPFALLVGMLLDQQVPMETAFAGPAKIAARMSTGDHLDPGRIAAADPEEFAALCATPPAVHRFPCSMAERIQAVARAVVEEYDGDAARLWTDGDPDGAEVLRRLRRLPGYGEQKAKIFLALLGKQRGVTARRVARGRRRLRRGGLVPLDRRRHGRRVPGQGPRDQEGREGRGQRAARR